MKLQPRELDPLFFRVLTGARCPLYVGDVRGDAWPTVRSELARRRAEYLLLDAAPGAVEFGYHALLTCCPLCSTPDCAGCDGLGVALTRMTGTAKVARLWADLLAHKVGHRFLAVESDKPGRLGVQLHSGRAFVRHWASSGWAAAARKLATAKT